MTEFYSPTAHATGLSSGFFIATPPPDAFLVSNCDFNTAINLPAGATYAFTAPTIQGAYGTLNITMPSDENLVQQAQSAQIALVQADYLVAINKSVSFKNVAGITSTYPSGKTVAINGQTAMQNLNLALDLGVSGWTLGKWLDTNNVAQIFTYADLQGLADVMGGAVQADWSDLVVKIAAIQSATSVDAVQAITF